MNDIWITIIFTHVFILGMGYIFGKCSQELKISKMIRILERIIEDVENIEYNAHAEGCGLEDRAIVDRYDAMEHGWNRAMESVAEITETIHDMEK